MVGDFFRLYTESVGDLGYIPYIYLILPPGGIVGEKPPTVGELGIQKSGFWVRLTRLSHSLRKRD